MDDENPYWLSEDFNPSRATKLELRRWLSRYEIPVPASDVKKDVLLKLWRDKLVPQRAELLEQYHTADGGLQEDSTFSPIANVTPARIHDVEVPRSSDSMYALAAGMFRRAGSIPGTPSPAAPETQISRAKGRVKEPSRSSVRSREISDHDDDETLPLSSDDDQDSNASYVGLGLGRTDGKENRREAEHHSRAKTSNVNVFQSCSAKGNSGAKQYRSPMVDPLVSTSDEEDEPGPSVPVPNVRGRRKGRTPGENADTRPASGRSSGEEIVPSLGGKDSRRPVRSSSKSSTSSIGTPIRGHETPLHRTPVPAEPKPFSPFSVGSPGGRFALQEGFYYDEEAERRHIENLLEGVRFRRSNRQPTQSPASPSAPDEPLDYDLPDEYAEPVRPEAPRRTRRTARSKSRDARAKLTRVPAPSLRRRTQPRPDCLDKFVGLVSRVLVILVVASISFYVYAWWTAGYCSHQAVSPVEDAWWQDNQPVHFADLVARWWPPRCTPCPSHAECEEGKVMRCVSSDYLLRSNGLGAKCVPDTEKQANIDKLAEMLASSIQHEVGKLSCAGQSVWISRDRVRSALLPPILKTQTAWTPEQSDLYTRRAMQDLISRPPSHIQVRRGSTGVDSGQNKSEMFEEYRVEPEMWITSSEPIFPLTCAVWRSADQFLHKYWHFAAGAAGMALVLGLVRRRYRQSRARRILIEQLTGEVVELLMEQEQSARTQAGEPGFLGVAALGSVFSRRMGLATVEWRPIWAKVQANMARDPNVRLITSKHKGEIMEAWEWIGFDALKKHHAKSKKA